MPHSQSLAPEQQDSWFHDSQWFLWQMGHIHKCVHSGDRARPLQFTGAGSWIPFLDFALSEASFKTGWIKWKEVVWEGHVGTQHRETSLDAMRHGSKVTEAEGRILECSEARDICKPIHGALWHLSL